VKDWRDNPHGIHQRTLEKANEEGITLSAYVTRVKAEIRRDTEKILCDENLWLWLFQGEARQTWWHASPQQKGRIVRAMLRLRVALNGADFVYISKSNLASDPYAAAGGFGPLSSVSKHHDAIRRAECVLKLRPEIEVIKSRDVEYGA
jgi:hypothetical protein